MQIFRHNEQMTSKERVLATFAHREPDRPPYWECAFWGETLDRWGREDFREIAKRLDPSSPEHLAADWKQRPLALQAACGLATAAARRSAWNQEQPDV